MLTRGKRLQKQQQQQHRTCPSPIICDIAIKQPELKKNQSKRPKGSSRLFPKGSKAAGKVGKVASKIVQLVVGEDEEDSKSKVKPPNQSASSDGPEYIDINDIMTEDEDFDESPIMHFQRDYNYPLHKDYRYLYSMGYHYPSDKVYNYPSDIGYRFHSDMRYSYRSYLSSYLISRTNSEEVYNPASYSFLKSRPLNSRYRSDFRSLSNYFDDHYRAEIEAFYRYRNAKISKKKSMPRLIKKRPKPKSIKKFVRPSSTPVKITEIATSLKESPAKKIIADEVFDLTEDDANNNEDNSENIQNVDVNLIGVNEVNNNESNQTETGPLSVEVDEDVQIITNDPVIEIIIDTEEKTEEVTSQVLEDIKLPHIEIYNTAPLEEYGVLTYYISSDDNDSDDEMSRDSCKIVGTYERNIAIMPNTKRETEEIPKIDVKKISEIKLDEPNTEDKKNSDNGSTENSSQHSKETNNIKDLHVSVKPKEITKPKITIVELSPSTVERLSMGELSKQTDVLYISSDEESEDVKLEAKQEQKCAINTVDVQTPPTMEGLQPSFNNAEVFQADTKGFQTKSELPEPASTVQNLQDDVSLISDEDSVIIIEPPIIDLTSQPSTSNATRVPNLKRKATNDDAGTKQRKINDYETSLTNSKIIADKFDIDRRTAENIVKFFDQDYTIPFIARYRKSDIGHLDANVLRDVKDTYDEVLELRKKKETVLKNLINRNDDDLKNAIMDCTNIDELNSLYSPFATTRVNKLKQALDNGLETVALNILENRKEENLNNCVKPNVEFISDIVKVEQAIILILANHICTRPEILKFIEAEKRLDKFIITSKRSKSPRTRVYPNIHYMKEERKYESYYNLTIKASKILPHQILALNRGKENKMLSVQYTHADSFLDKFMRACTNKWYFDWFTKRGKLLRQAIQYAYDKIVCPIIQKHVKATLKMKAEKCSINVFSNNLRQLLLKAPTRGRMVLGIDPGFKNGCKIALISETGSVVEAAIIYPHVIENRRNMDDLTLQSMLLKYSCTLVALGNGKGCKETEMWLAHLIQANFFAPLEVKYAIVNESGSSIYSCSREASQEFQGMDPCLISAVHLARRFQDPLLELVKVDPKHLGVGMYQHDLPESKLQKALDTVISECVSNVGVNLNTASLYLLKHVSGLTSTRAANIIAYRQTHGLFKSREHLKRVRGIGEKTYEQCAGFLKIMETDISNKFDSTIIHPESYDVTRRILVFLNMTMSQVGQQACIAKVQNSTYALYERYADFGISRDSMKVIIEALSAPLDYDFRGEFEIKPLMHRIVTSMWQLKVGHILEGRTTNLTTFGCFVHVGCEKEGLIPSKELENVVLGIGDRIQVEVLTFDPSALRLSLRYLKHV